MDEKQLNGQQNMDSSQSDDNLQSVIFLPALRKLLKQKEQAKQAYSD